MTKNINNDIFEAYLEKLVPDNKSRELLKNIFLKQQKDAEVKVDSTKFRRVSLDKAVTDVKKLLDVNKAMRSSLIELKNENVKMIDKYRKLISALGACECLGENPICPMCEGRGIPGSRSIDEASFFHYVYPLIQRITVTATEDPGSEAPATKARQN